MKIPHGDPTNVIKLHCPYQPHHSERERERVGGGGVFTSINK